LSSLYAFTHHEFYLTITTRITALIHNLCRDIILNKLALLAFVLLILLGAMSWLLADASLNQYLQSQVVLQGKYYTKQNVILESSEYSPDSGQGHFKGLQLKSTSGLVNQNLLDADAITFSMAKFKEGDKYIKVASVNIDNLIINVEQNSRSNKALSTTNNIALLKAVVLNQLANDYPKAYPEISAKKYALKNPQLNADVYIEQHPQITPQIDNGQKALPKPRKKKKRGKQYTKITAPALHINTLTVNYFNGVELIKTITKNNIKTHPIGGKTGIETNQLGGEILISLLNLVQPVPTNRE
jgi:hypothetical protein